MKCKNLQSKLNKQSKCQILALDVTAEIFARCFGKVCPGQTAVSLRSCAGIPEERRGPFRSRNRSVGVAGLELIKKLSE